jgi:ATP-dependent DNA ligase
MVDSACHSAARGAPAPCCSGIATHSGCCCSRSSPTHRSAPAGGAHCPGALPRPVDGQEWLFEAKYDGFRGLLYLTGRECCIRSKRGNHLRRLDQLCHWVRDELVERMAILDGEVVALDEYGRQDFRLLMRGGGNLHYAVFDVLWLKGRDLRECPLSRRKRVLSRLVKKTSTVLSPVFGVRGRGPGSLRGRRASGS